MNWASLGFEPPPVPQVAQMDDAELARELEALADRVLADGHANSLLVHEAAKRLCGHTHKQGADQ